ncbi:MAG TPA: hypothetical protein VF713_12660, partial [Thermoanaerobaculia bacterium]
RCASGAGHLALLAIRDLAMFDIDRATLAWSTGLHQVINDDVLTKVPRAGGASDISRWQARSAQPPEQVR